MDFLCDSDHKLCEMDDSDMGELLDHDVFQSPTSMSSDGYVDNDWFNSLFEDPVLNDKMITDAVQPPRIQSEHSYSINDNSVPSSPLGLGKLEDLDSEFFGNNQALDLTTKQTTNSIPCLSQSQANKSESSILDTVNPMLTTVTTTTTRTISTTKQPTIILATPATQQLQSQSTQQQQQIQVQQPPQISSPVVTIKTEPYDYLPDSMEQTVNVDPLILPPTPPSSASSDSEGGQSPQRSAPSSPVRQLPVTRHIQSSSPSSHKPYSQPLFTSPIPQSGLLILTEEEKRTLISEGYPIPAKLPLTKQEEKNLKKIRRKIKNKISAQESRRKKKEYLEALEKRVEAFSQENNDLKKKVENLETNNRSLLGQLQKLQSLVGKVTRQGSGTTQTGTVLMVLVLCFAVFLGSWSPSSFNIGYSSSPYPVDGVSFFANPRLLQPGPRMGPSIQDVKTDPYSTPNMKSRVLLSMREENEDYTLYHPYGPMTPKGDQEFLEREEMEEKNPLDVGPEVAKGVDVPLKSKVIEVVTVDKTIGLPNMTRQSPESDQSIMHPDIAAPANFLDKAVDAETA